MKTRIILIAFAIMMFGIMANAQTHVKAFDGHGFATLTVGGAGSLYQSQLPVVDLIAGQPIRVGVGDVNGDGVADVIVGAQVNGHVKSAPTRRPTGDVDGDGISDVVTGTSPIPHVKTAPIRRRGGDINNDGFDDVIVGATGASGHVKTSPVPCTNVAPTSTRKGGKDQQEYLTIKLTDVLVTSSQPSWKNTCRLLTVQLRDGTKYFGTIRFR